MRGEKKKLLVITGCSVTPILLYKGQEGQETHGKGKHCHMASGRIKTFPGPPGGWYRLEKRPFNHRERKDVFLCQENAICTLNLRFFGSVSPESLSLVTVSLESLFGLTSDPSGGSFPGFAPHQSQAKYMYPGITALPQQRIPWKTTKPPKNSLSPSSFCQTWMQSGAWKTQLYLF